MQYLYSFQFIENEDTKVHKKYFNDCFSSVNSLFVTLVSLIIELQNKSQKQLNISKKSISGIQNKRYLSKNFSQNLLIKNLSNNRIILKEIANKNIVNWDIYKIKYGKKTITRDYLHSFLTFSRIIDSHEMIYQFYE